MVPQLPLKSWHLFSEGFIPANTEANTEWAVRNFQSWAEWRCTAQPIDPVPRDILTCGDVFLINKWLSLYVIETRKKNGDRYPCSTLNLLLCEYVNMPFVFKQKLIIFVCHKFGYLNMLFCVLSV